MRPAGSTASGGRLHPSPRQPLAGALVGGRPSIHPGPGGTAGAARQVKKHHTAYDIARPRRAGRPRLGEVPPLYPDARGLCGAPSRQREVHEDGGDLCARAPLDGRQGELARLGVLATRDDTSRDRPAHGLLSVI